MRNRSTRLSVCVTPTNGIRVATLLHRPPGMGIRGDSDLVTHRRRQGHDTEREWSWSREPDLILLTKPLNWLLHRPKRLVPMSDLCGAERSCRDKAQIEHFHAQHFGLTGGFDGSVQSRSASRMGMDRATGALRCITVVGEHGVVRLVGAGGQAGCGGGICCVALGVAVQCCRHRGHCSQTSGRPLWVGPALF